MDAWDRQRDPDANTLEPTRWFGRFDQFFRPLGSERTLEEAHQRWCDSRPPDSHRGKRPGKQWYRMARKWNWFERAGEWDRHIADEARAIEKTTLLERQRIQREREWKIAGQLEEKLAHMLRFPLATVTRPDGDGNVTIVEPVRWSQRDVVAFAKAIAELGRLAADLEQGTTVVQAEIVAIPMTLEQWREQAQKRRKEIEEC